MFDFLKSSKHAGMDAIVQRIHMNMENNYKDAAQENLKQLEAKYAALRDAQALSDKQIRYYDEVLAGYRERMLKFTHKDQTPYWK